MTAKFNYWAMSTFVVSVLPMLGGCLGVSDHPVARVDSVDEQPAIASSYVGPPIKTVKRSGSSPDVRADSVQHEAAIPSPSEIFNFHPPGSKPDSWRQPFIIDPNDGPLAGYVRRMDAELQDSNRQVKTVAQTPVRRKPCLAGGVAGTVSKDCGENAVAKALAR